MFYVKGVYHFMKHRIYRNKCNEHKFIEVKIYDCGHVYIKQFMFWYTSTGVVINYLASRSKRGVAHRISKKTLNQILEDYTICNFGYLER